MATLANLGGVALIQEGQTGLPVSIVALVAIYASGCVGVARLPLRQKYVEVIIEILPLADIGMAFIAICIADALSQRRRLFVIAAQKSQ